MHRASWAGLGLRRLPGGMSLLKMSLALAIVALLSIACSQGEDPTPTPEPAPPATVAPTSTPAPTATAAPTAASEPEAVDDDELTRAFVEKAVAYYEANGLDATIERYSDPASREGERQLSLLNAETYVVLASAVNHLIGNKLTSFAPGGPFAGESDRAGEEGRWIDGLVPNARTGGQQEPARIFIVVLDGLVFMSMHFVVIENVADTTKEYVNRAIRYYDDNGLDATVEYYNSRESMDGQFYLFMMDENDIYLVHPFLPDLISTDLKAVTSSDNPQLGRDIAQATEEGIWVEYLWPNPVTLNEETKVTWAMRHDGKIFASGYYAGREEAATPPWVGVNPRDYTVDYVNRAIERYERFGLESVKAYYNSVASFEGEWYLFATDASDIYVIHPVFSRLIGTDINDVASSDGYELGKEIAKATEEGHWIEYPWPHPITLSEAPKVSYAKRHGGHIFASGYYPLPDDPEGYTRNYVQKAIDMYESEGLEATVAHYNSRESMDGQWYMVDHRRGRGDPRSRLPSGPSREEREGFLCHRRIQHGRGDAESYRGRLLVPAELRHFADFRKNPDEHLGNPARRAGLFVGVLRRPVVGPDQRLDYALRDIARRVKNVSCRPDSAQESSVYIDIL